MRTVAPSGEWRRKHAWAMYSSSTPPASCAAPGSAVESTVTAAAIGRIAAVSADARMANLRAMVFPETGARVSPMLGCTVEREADNGAGPATRPGGRGHALPWRRRSVHPPHPGPHGRWPRRAVARRRGRSRGRPRKCRHTSRRRALTATRPRGFRPAGSPRRAGVANRQARASAQWAAAATIFRRRPAARGGRIRPRRG